MGNAFGLFNSKLNRDKRVLFSLPFKILREHPVSFFLELAVVSSYLLIQKTFI